MSVGQFAKFAVDVITLSGVNVRNDSSNDFAQYLNDITVQFWNYSPNNETFFREFFLVSIKVGINAGVQGMRKAE